MSNLVFYVGAVLLSGFPIFGGFRNDVIIFLFHNKKIPSPPSGGRGLGWGGYKKPARFTLARSVLSV